MASKAKRGRVDEDDVEKLRHTLLEQLAVYLELDVDILKSSLSISPPLPTLLELGIKSVAMAPLKG